MWCFGTGCAPLQSQWPLPVVETRAGKVECQQAFFIDRHGSTQGDGGAGGCGGGPAGREDWLDSKLTSETLSYASPHPHNHPIGKMAPNDPS